MTRRGRPPYTIKPADVLLARQWIDNAMVRGEVDRTSGYTRYGRAVTADKLQEWCDDYLSRDQWRKLKSTIHKQRKRDRDAKRNKSEVQVSLSKPAWKTLKKRSESFDLTLSDTIIEMDKLIK